MYCTLEELKAYITVDVTEDDEMLERFIAQSQGIIDVKCKRTFEAEADATRRFDTVADVDGMLLTLDADLCQITTITNGDGVVVTSGQYVTEPRNSTPWYGIRLKQSSGVYWTYSTDPENAISILGRWAYSLTAPDEINWVCIRLAKWLYNQRDTSSDAERPMMSGSGMVIIPSNLPKDIMGVLEGFIRQ